MSRRNRNNPHKTAPSERNHGQEKMYRFTEPPAPPNLTDLSKIRIIDDPNPTPPPSEPDAGATAGTDGDAQTHSCGSRANSLRAGLRSRILYPEQMLAAIDALARAFTVQYKPSTAVAEWLVWQMARGSVQSEFAADQLLVNLRFSVERAENGWPDARREQAQKLGRTIARAPYRVAQTLGRCKYGAIHLIERLTAIDDIIKINGCLDGQQREMLLDVLGVDHVLRNGCNVPAGHDGPGLAAVVAREIAQLTAKIAGSLNAMDRLAQEAAQYGIVKQHDQETRQLRGDQARGDRRFKWALATLQLVEQGQVDPATIIDPETQKPINPDEPVSSVPAAAPPGPAPPPSTSPSLQTFEMPAIPAGCPENVKQMFLLIGEACLRREGPATPPEPPADEPSGKPGPQAA